jgi:cyanophycin synthetase
LFIKEDGDLRGRAPGETAEILRRGALDAGIASDRITTILDEGEAVLAALAAARPGDLVVVFYEEYEKVMAVIDAFKEGVWPARTTYAQGFGTGAAMTANSL